MSHGNSYGHQQDLEINDLKAENARIRAELEALKPGPVVKVVKFCVDKRKSCIEFFESDGIVDADNLELTFEGDKLTHAEVLK